MQRNFELLLFRAIGTLVGLAWLGVAIPAYAQLGLGMVPMRVELHLAPGQEYTGALKLSNQSNAKTRVRAEVLDFNIDATTTPQFERNLPGEAAYSCKKWLTLNPMEMELENGASVTARYTLRAPANLAEGSYNCAAGFTTLPSAEQASAGIGMRMAVRIVAAIYVVVGSPPIRGGLKEFKLEAVAPTKQLPQGGWQAVVVLENQGTMYFRPSGKLQVVNDQNQVVETEDFTPLPVLRQRTQRFVFALKVHLEPGKYKLRARVDIGTGEIQEGSADVSVDAAPPPTAH